MGDFDEIRYRTFDHWRDAMLEACEKLPDQCCPFCHEVYDDIAEYVDVGVGQLQVTGNRCENPECGAQEQGAYVYEGSEWEFANGWVRHKYESPSGPRTGVK